MRLSQAIDIADRMRPNTLIKEEKVNTILKLETEIAEMMGIDAPQWDIESEDPELIAPAAHEMVYPYMLLPFIDHYQEETDLYQIDMVMANQALAEYKAWWSRNHEHKSTQIKGVFI